MTLIVSAATWWYVVQASDRLVSDGGRPFDAHSNKAILYFAPDAVASIAYTGTAFVDEIHTDTWIVEQLLSYRFSRTDPMPMALGGGLVRLPPIGQAASRLRSAVATAFDGGAIPTGAKSHPFEIVLCGWIWHQRRRVGRPFIWVIRREASTGEVSIIRSPRYPLLGPQTSDPRERGSQLLVYVTPQAHRDVLGSQGFWRRLLPTESAAERQAVLVDGIRDAAKVYPGYIGRHCMVTEIPPPGQALVSITYHPDSDVPMASTPAAYKPWVVSAGLQSPPTVSSIGGDARMLLGGWTVLLSDASEQEPRPGRIRSQPRRPLSG